MELENVLETMQAELQGKISLCSQHQKEVRYFYVNWLSVCWVFFPPISIASVYRDLSICETHLPHKYMAFKFHKHLCNIKAVALSFSWRKLFRMFRKIGENHPCQGKLVSLIHHGCSGLPVFVRFKHLFLQKIGTYFVFLYLFMCFLKKIQITLYLQYFSI